MKNVPDSSQTEEIPVNNEVNDAIQQILQKAENAKGSYLTPFDRLLLEFLYTEKVVINTEDLWMTLKAKGVKISIATVQLCLNRLYRCEMVSKQRRDGEKRYYYSIINQL